MKNFSKSASRKTRRNDDTLATPSTSDCGDEFTQLLQMKRHALAHVDSRSSSRAEETDETTNPGIPEASSNSSNNNITALSAEVTTNTTRMQPQGIEDEWMKKRRNILMCSATAASSPSEANAERDQLDKVPKEEELSSPPFSGQHYKEARGHRWVITSPDNSAVSATTSTEPPRDHQTLPLQEVDTSTDEHGDADEVKYVCSFTQ